MSRVPWTTTKHTKDGREVKISSPIPEEPYLSQPPLASTSAPKPSQLSPPAGSSARSPYHNRAIFPVRTTGLNHSRPGPHPYSPLESNPETKPSSFEEPLPPSPSSATPEPLNIEKLLLPNPLFPKAQYEDVLFDSVGKQPELSAPPRANAPQSFAAEIDSKFARSPSSLYSKHWTVPDWINKGPHSNSMPDNKGSMTKRDLARYCSLAVLAILSLAALALGASALVKVQNLEAASTYISSTTGPSTSTSQRATSTSSIISESDDEATEDITSTPSLSHIKTHIPSQFQWPGTTPKPKSSAKTTHDIASSFATDAIVRRDGYVTMREEAIIWPEPCDETLTVTVTITSTITIKASTTCHICPQLSQQSSISALSTVYQSTTQPLLSSSISIASTIYQTNTQLSASSSLPPSQSSNAAARRYVAPLSWDNLRSWFIATLSYRATASSAVPTPTVSRRGDGIEQFLSRASTDAAVPIHKLPWSYAPGDMRPPPPPTRAHHERRQQASQSFSPMDLYDIISGKPQKVYTPLEALPLLYVQAYQLCQTTKAYWNTIFTPPYYQNAGDDLMGTTVNQTLCYPDSNSTVFPTKEQKCMNEFAWDNLNKAVGIICNATRVGVIVRPPVEFLCIVYEGLVDHVACEGSANSTSTSPVTHDKRQQPARPYTYWEAYSILRNQAVQLCFAKQTYQNSTLTPSSAQNPGDGRMADIVNRMICTALNGTWSALPQGERCGTRNEWLSISSNVQTFCGVERTGQTVKQSVDLFCKVKDELGRNVEECNRNGSATFAALSTTLDSAARSSSPLAGFTSLTTSASAISTSLSLGFSSVGKQHSEVEATRPTSSGSAYLLTTAAPVKAQADNFQNSPAEGTGPTATQLGVLPPYPKLTPPPDWTIDMITYTDQAPSTNYANGAYGGNTMPLDDPTRPPAWTGAHLERTWSENYPFPIPTGYVAPNIVPRGEQIGHLTQFNNGTGACGEPAIRSNELAVAISWVLFDMGREIGGSVLEPGWKDGNLVNGISHQSSALCNRWIRAWMGDGKGGKVVEQRFVVRDRCTACNVTHIDIQDEILAKYWAPKEVGRVSVTWEWMETEPTAAP